MGRRIHQGKSVLHIGQIRLEFYHFPCSQRMGIRHIYFRRVLLDVIDPEFIMKMWAGTEAG